MKVLSYKVLKEYSVEESEEFDMKIYVKFREGFWFFAKETEHVVYRCNPVTRFTRCRPIRWHLNTDCYYYEDGSCLNNNKASVLHSTMADDAAKKRHEDYKSKMNSELDKIKLL